MFEELSPEQSGVRFVHRLNENALHAYLYHSGYACGGVVIGDVNSDDWPDLFLVSGPDENALFLNRGGFRFERSSAELEDGPSWGAGAGMVDIEGDGDLDIYVCNYDSANRLFVNDGSGKFSEGAFAAGLAFTGPSLCPYFADFDSDGDLDLFLLTNRLYSPSGYPRERAWDRGSDGVARVKDRWAPHFEIVEPPFPTNSPDPWLQEYGHADRLFRNDGVDAAGRLRFKDVTADSGIGTVHGHGLSAVIWDVNSDGLPDIYVANDFIDPDRLWINLGPDASGALRFRDATDEYLPYTPWFSMGSDVADLNNDGRLDLFVADMAATTHFKAKTTMGEMTGMRRWVMENGWPRQLMRNCLFVDSGAGRFLEAAFMAGVARSDWTWAVRLADFDLDGRVDIYLTNGTARAFSDSDVVLTSAMRIGRTEWDLYRNLPAMPETNMAFRNEGDLRFSSSGETWGLARQGMSYAAASGDFDRDGDPDLIVCHLTENVSLYRNRAADSGANWITFRLVGGGRNSSAFGARVSIDTPAGPQVRLIQPQTGFLSGNESVAHFGLGTRRRCESIRVRWPGGAEQTLPSEPAGRVVVIREPDRAAQGPTRETRPVAPASTSALPPPQFTEVAEMINLRFRHDDRPFDDYQREFLLPGKLSQFGPGMAVGDMNSDGLEDVFIGGAAGQPGGLFVHHPDHSFAPIENPPWARHAASEDMGALLFDADRDSDLDLYVVSGSTEWDPGHEIYADHLYLNECGTGRPALFVDAPEQSLPPLRQSGSCVVASDFDRDGDLDLFVGGRSIPGSYPAIPESVLLRNESAGPGQVLFLDVTDGSAPGLRRAGLVTGALWSDVDGDGWTDLLVTCEWGPVRVFLNRAGRLADATSESGLTARTGWWNSISGGDVDCDGDTDYLVLNSGLNTKYGQPREDKPLILYRGDMDGQGGDDLVEAKPDHGAELPVRGRSCSGNAMPFIKEKFPTFKAFASAKLAEIYSPLALQKADRVMAVCLESGCLINESKPGRIAFRWVPLPPAVQISPAFGSVSADFFGDGKLSWAVAQNLFSREPETGLWRGGLGCLLRLGEPAGAFTAASHTATGFVVAGDAKGLATLDLDGDAHPDLVVTQNNDRVMAFRNRAPTDDRRSVSIALDGPAGNPTGVGARVTVRCGGRLSGSAEIYAGSGYLSQSSPRFALAFPADHSPLEISVIWPDGHASRHHIEAGRTKSESVHLKP